jgi:hypothetical protein
MPCDDETEVKTSAPATRPAAASFTAEVNLLIYFFLTILGTV